MNILLLKIANNNSIILDKDKRDKKKKELLVKADLTDNEKKLLAMILERDALINVLEINEDPDIKGTNLLAYYKLRDDPETAGLDSAHISLSEDILKYGYRDNALSLAHEMGHGYQADYGNTNPIFDDLSKYVETKSKDGIGTDKETLADKIARGLLARIGSSPELTDKAKLELDPVTKPYDSEQDSLDMDVILRKLLKEPKQQQEGPFDKGQTLLKQWWDNL